MNLNIIEPNYFKEFHCIGGECRNNCCHDGWHIYLRKNEYINIKNAKKSKELQTICDNSFKRLRKSDNPNVYAEMRLKENGTCHFLDSDGLCMLQKECGYNVLSNTCKQFPRIYFQYMNSAEQYLSTGCEEVIRLLMDMPDGIELTNGGEIDHTKLMYPTFAVIDKKELSTYPFKYYWDIKTLIITIIKNRSYSIEDRLILLGIAFKHIDELVKTDNGDKIASYVDGLIAACSADNSMLDGIKGIEADSYKNVLNFAFMLKGMIDAELLNKSLYEKIEKNFGIGYIKSGTTGKMSFIANREKVEKQLGMFFNMISGREYILENFILNSMLYMNIPFTDTSLSFWDSYLFYCMTYSTMIFMMAGNIDEESTDKDIIDSFAVFSRCLFHHPYLPESISDYMKNKDLSSLGAMVSLIKF